MPVGPIGNHIQRAAQLLACAHLQSHRTLTAVPFSHPTSNDVAKQQRISAGLVESPVQSGRQVVPVRAHLHSKRLQSHGRDELGVEESKAGMETFIPWPGKERGVPRGTRKRRVEARLCCCESRRCLPNKTQRSYAAPPTVRQGRAHVRLGLVMQERRPASR
jgi:hypothetical protein